MAQRYLVPTRETSLSTMAPPVLAPDLLYDFDMSDEQGFFQMDDPEFVQEDNHVDTLESLKVDVDQAQECRCSCAQLARVEAGSAHRSLSGQLAVPPVQTPTRPMASSLPRQIRSTTGQPPLSVQLPASMPRAIASPVDTPSIAVSQWPQHVSFSEHRYADTPYTFVDFPYDDVPANTPSTSFQSPVSSWLPWSETQSFQHASWHGGDLLSPVTAPSSFDMTTQYLSSPTSLSSLPVVFPQLQLHEELDDSMNPTQVVPLHAESSQTTRPLPNTNVSSWAQGAYTVSDRTNFGSLAHPTALPAPSLRRRRASHSRTGSSTSLSCEGCGRLFASRAERDHHARWHGPKTQICAVCGKGFIASKDLRRHEKIHRPTEHTFFCDHFGCSYGRRGFARKDHLLRHQKTHGSAVSSLNMVPGYSASF